MVLSQSLGYLWTYALVLTNFVIKFSILVTNELEKTLIMSNDEDLSLIGFKKIGQLCLNTFMFQHI